VNQQQQQPFLAQKNTKHVHVLGLEGHTHDTNTGPKTNCATTIEENIYKSNSGVEQSMNNYTVSQKTSPTFLAITRESIDGFL